MALTEPAVTTGTSPCYERRKRSQVNSDIPCRSRTMRTPSSVTCDNCDNSTTCVDDASGGPAQHRSWPTAWVSAAFEDDDDDNHHDVGVSENSWGADDSDDEDSSYLHVSLMSLSLILQSSDKTSRQGSKPSSACSRHVSDFDESTHTVATAASDISDFSGSQCGGFTSLDRSFHEELCLRKTVRFDSIPVQSVHTYHKVASDELCDYFYSADEMKSFSDDYYCELAQQQALSILPP